MSYTYGSPNRFPSKVQPSTGLACLLSAAVCRCREQRKPESRPRAEVGGRSGGERMSRKELLANIVLFEVAALGVFFAHLLAWMHATDGTITLDMTMFGERFVEYWAMMLLMALTPWAVYTVTSD